MSQNEIGYKSGIDGTASFESALNHFKSTCEEDHGIKVNPDQIKQGWEDGHRFYCSPNGGQRAGTAGLNYSGVCSKEDEKKFFESYNPARLGFLENKVKQLELDNDSLRRDLNSAQSELSSFRLNSLRGECPP